MTKSTLINEFKTLSRQEQEEVATELSEYIKATALEAHKEELKKKLAEAVDRGDIVSYRNYSYIPKIRQPNLLDLMLARF